MKRRRETIDVELQRIAVELGDRERHQPALFLELMVHFAEKMGFTRQDAEARQYLLCNVNKLWSVPWNNALMLFETLLSDLTRAHRTYGETCAEYRDIKEQEQLAYYHPMNEETAMARVSVRVDVAFRELYAKQMRLIFACGFVTWKLFKHYATFMRFPGIEHAGFKVTPEEIPWNERVERINRLFFELKDWTYIFKEMAGYEKKRRMTMAHNFNL